MEDKPMTLPEIRRAGMEALCQRLGPAGMLKFLKLYDSGCGDYTEERHKWLDDVTIEQVVEDIGKYKNKD